MSKDKQTPKDKTSDSKGLNSNSELFDDLRGKLPEDHMDDNVDIGDSPYGN